MQGRDVATDSAGRPPVYEHASMSCHGVVSRASHMYERIICAQDAFVPPCSHLNLTV